MLSNLILNEKKCILFIDEIGVDSHAETIMANLFNEINEKNYIIYPTSVDAELKTVHFDDTQPKHNVIVRPITQLLIDHKLSQILTELNKMILVEGNRIGRILLWITANKIPHEFITHFFEYIADTIVKFKDSKNLSVLTKRSSGDATLRAYSYETVRNNAGNDVIMVKEIKKVKTKVAETVKNPEEIGTFKIKLEEEEMIARNALQLPYEKVRDGSGTADSTRTDSQIIYSPDLDDDDYDDEDPDDDLDI